jgi:glutaredoxin
MPTRRAFLLQSAALCAASVVMASCKEGGDDARGATDPSAMPAVEFTEETPDLLITFIDDRGETHVVQRPSAVPRSSATYVRVDLADAPRAPGAVYVSDLTSEAGGGQYRARGVPRAEWEAEIERRRNERPAVAAATAPKERSPSRAPEPRPDAPEPSAPVPAPEPGEPSGGEGGEVIVYGAPWCGACSQAKRYLQGKGVKTVWKDIDADSTARVEMDGKLTKHGGRKGSIPVLDIRGKILVGFSARKIDDALQATAPRSGPGGGAVRGKPGATAM